MNPRIIRMKLRRLFRQRKKKVQKASADVGEVFDKNVALRWRNFGGVRRFVLGWMLLIALLMFGVFLQSRQLRPYYLDLVSVDGGVLREGLVGEITNMNPIFATNPADRAAAKLMFSTLFIYDKNGNLTGDLASDFSVSDDGRVYTVTLRQGAVWHDGEPVAADDVEFTYRRIKHPDSNSPLSASWRDIDIEAVDDQTVVFTLPNRFTPFPDAWTRGGILPKHILQNVEPDQMRGASFNVSSPIGSGPFQYDDAVEVNSERSSIRFVKNDEYYAGSPRLDRFHLELYQNGEQIVQDFLDGQLSTIAGVTVDDIQLESEEILSRANWYDIPLNSTVFLFFKTSDPILSSTEIRQALGHGIDTVDIRRQLDFRFLASDSPLLAEHIGYDKQRTQRSLNIEKANELLDQQGWVLGEDGFRAKGDQKLEIQIVTQASDDYAEVARTIKEQWQKIGVATDVLVVNEDEIQQNYITAHNYQSLLIGVSVGNDPDVFVYWHSSQATVGGFNFSEYQNDIVDDALEAGRTREDGDVRAAKYHTFLDQWRADTPAMALYRPGFGYVQRSNVSGYTVSPIISPSDRFNTVHEWQVAEELRETVL